MPKQRGKEHTTLTETAKLVVKEIKRIPGIKMVAPGQINVTKGSNAGKRFVTVVYTRAGCELIISGQSTQKVAVHMSNTKDIIPALKKAKSLREFTFKERERKPGI
ncbi:MAG: DUF2103 domain-containing protein [Candidatus Pacebacteria bacterium]|nr:DUF2103 domain-containing protein [Candidatus Paceibacterota bacterium]